MATSEQIFSQAPAVCEEVSKSPATYSKDLRHIKSSIRHRNVCATLNNYTEMEYQLAKHFIHNACSYGIVAKEVGDECKTPHLQCYFEFSGQKTQLSLLKLLGENVNDGKPVKWYFGERKGSPKQASDYCRYADYDRKTHSGTVLNDYIEAGELSKQGERTDWKEAVSAIARREDIADVIIAQPQLLPNIRALERFQQITLKPKHRPNIKVIVRYGKAGCGKSHYAHQLDDVYSKPAGAWWDGYKGQKVILMDDYNGSFMAHNELLRVLDKWAYNLQIKGGYVQAQYETVIITSNNPPWRWYRDGLRPQLARRLHEVYYIQSRTQEELIDLTPHIIPDEVIDEEV